MEPTNKADKEDNQYFRDIAKINKEIEIIKTKAKIKKQKDLVEESKEQ